ncbi:MAG: hypothetical protein Sapg2KO_14250 [Saprospiraceae bacterium]
MRFITSWSFPFRQALKKSSTSEWIGSPNDSVPLDDKGGSKKVLLISEEVLIKLRLDFVLYFFIRLKLRP